MLRRMDPQRELLTAGWATSKCRVKLGPAKERNHWAETALVTVPASSWTIRYMKEDNEHLFMYVCHVPSREPSQNFTVEQFLKLAWACVPLCMDSQLVTQLNMHKLAHTATIWTGSWRRYAWPVYLWWNTAVKLRRYYCMLRIRL